MTMTTATPAPLPAGTPPTPPGKTFLEKVRRYGLIAGGLTLGGLVTLATCNYINKDNQKYQGNAGKKEDNQKYQGGKSKPEENTKYQGKKAAEKPAPTPVPKVEPKAAPSTPDKDTPRNDSATPLRSALDEVLQLPELPKVPEVPMPAGIPQAQYVQVSDSLWGHMYDQQNNIYEVGTLNTQDNQTVFVPIQDCYARKTNKTLESITFHNKVYTSRELPGLLKYLQGGK